MKQLVYLQFLVFALTGISSCSKSNETVSPTPAITDSVANITSYKILEINPSITATPYAINIRFADTITNANNLIASFTSTPGTEVTLNGVKQISGVTKNNFNSTLFYTVTNSQGFSRRWSVTSTNNDYTVDWGLGNFVKQSLSNDRSYKWYYNQDASGRYSSINCGPTCATMALKWADSTYQRTPSDARDHYPQNTGLWGMGTIAAFLADNNCRYTSVLLGDSPEKTRDIIKAQLDKGRISILILSTSKIRSQVGLYNNPKVDRYYPESFNHFIVVYGYKEVDGEFYFQVNDPWGYGYFNKDGTLSASGRFYRYEDIFEACIKLDNSALSIFKR